MIFSSEKEMLDYGKKLGQKLDSSAVVELVGDVGTGKTTLSRGIAEGLGVKEPVTSPSFTIVKRYSFTNSKGEEKYLAHYDFYRLPDPGIMSDDLAESISDKNTITVIEWADTVASILPDNRITIHIKLNDDGTRTVEFAEKQ